MLHSHQLVSIMFTDIVGYSALMGRDEVQALRMLEVSNELQKAQVDLHQGKWIKELGDGVIITFGSVLNAVNCAIEIQKKVRNEDGLSLKIVIHAGEVVYRDNGVFGDTVNLTARMEQLGQGNSIILSGAALATISSIKSVETAFLGDFTLKNIAQPVSLHAVLGEGLVTPDLSGNELAARDGNEKTTSKGEQLALHVKKVIDENLTNPQLSVTFLCHELGISRPQLYRKLQAETGFAPSDFIREIRLRKAAKLLEEDQCNVSEVAYQTGFNNLSYFSKCFQQRFELTPSEYQKKGQHVTNIPQALDKFIGREKEIKEIIEILKKTRLLTLTGTGGTGKTRLATEVFAKSGSTFRDGAHVIQLAPVSEASQVLSKIAQVLKIQQDPSIETIETIKDVIGDREVLLFLDNFEHVLAAGTHIRALLMTCSRLKILVTSRAVLNIQGEHEYLVPQLAVPQNGTDYDLNDMANIPSVALFIIRAQAVKTNFELNEENKEAIIGICQHLDGLPLALELAAARIKLFSPPALLKRLESNLDILSSNAADQPDRHKTLRNAIDWSYNLLSPEEQTLFRRLSVFHGGCTLQAAEAVCFHGYEDNLEIIESMSDLVDKSLLQRATQADGEPRFHLLETIKSYAQERLERSEEKEIVMSSYVNYFNQEVQQIEAHLTGPDQGKWCDIIDIDLDNLRAILRWSEEQVDGATGLQIAVSFWRYWVLRSMMREGSRWLRRMLDIISENGETIIRCRALNAYGIMFGTTSKIFDASPIFEEALAIARKIQYLEGMAEALNHLGWVYQYLNDLKGCEDSSKEALQIYQELNNQRGISVAYSNLAQAGLYRCQLADSLELYEKAASIRNEIGDTRGYAFNRVNAAWTSLHMGFYSEACEKAEEARKILSELSDKQLSAWSLTIQAFALFYNKQLDQAEVLLQEAQPLWERSGNTRATVISMLLHTSVLYAKGKFAKSRTFLESIEKDVAEGVFGSNVYRYHYIQALLELKRTSAENILPSVKSNLEQIIEKGLLVFLADNLELISELLFRREAQQLALMLFSASAKFRKEYLIPVPPVRQDFYNQTLNKLKDFFETAEFDRLWVQGQSTIPEECLELIKLV